MNRIVLEHYPVEKLPEDLRKHFSRGGSVTLEVKEEAEGAQRPMTATEAAHLIRENLSRNVKRRTEEEIVAEVRALRDEWND